MPQTYYIDAWGGRQVTDTIEFPQEPLHGRTTCRLHENVRLNENGECLMCKTLQRIWKGRRDDW